MERAYIYRRNGTRGSLLIRDHGRVMTFSKLSAEKLGAFLHVRGWAGQVYPNPVLRDERALQLLHVDLPLTLAGIYERP